MAGQAADHFTVPEDSSVYYGGGYWNELPLVIDFIDRRASHQNGVRWFQHLLAATGGRPFRKGLFLNCGNGWVERDLLQAGVVHDAVGIDFGADLLTQARDAAAAQSLSARYYQCDVNDASFPEGGYDLVVNYAAAHHIARLDKVFRAVARGLPDDGVFASFDYVGPHRNQYPYDQWQAAHDLNDSLPQRFRARLEYPHLPTMIADDPTEAIHSELIDEVMRRYFTVEEFNPVGGGLGYLLLTFNEGVHRQPGPDRDAVVEQILRADVEWTDAHMPMFAFFWGRPDKSVLADESRLGAWSAEEDSREARAMENGGLYYPLTVLQHLTQDQHALRQQVEQLTHERDAAEALVVQQQQRMGLRRAAVSALDVRAPRLAAQFRRAKRGLRSLRR